MLALYTLDSGAGINRALKDVQDAQHRSHTGVL